MNKGIIDKTFLGEFIIIYSEKLDNGQKLYQQLPIHPHFKRYIFYLGQEVNFQYANECHTHYPKTCQCSKLTLFALPIFKPQKQTVKSFLIAIFKKLFKIK
jgi:hypothetical protein